LPALSALKGKRKLSVWISNRLSKIRCNRDAAQFMR
jgi:hypothetical protein